MSKKDDLKIEIAPQEAIKFNQMIIDFFIIKILGINSYMITDSSYVSDMMKDKASDGKQISQDEWEFTSTYYESGKAKQETGKHFFQLTPQERERYKKTKTYIAHRSELVFEEQILAQVKELFGVEIEASDLDGSFVDLGFKISSKISPEKRKELEKEYLNL
jgi:hypothetical protein